MKAKWAWAMAFGALLGGTLTSWLAPKVIAWYFDPPVGFGVSCKASIEWALGRLQLAQWWGIGVGAVLSLVIYLLVARKRQQPHHLESGTPS